MHDLPPLETLGQRICILGPTNAGKSTLCAAIARKLGTPAIHLDQFRHLPNTDWQVRPDAEFHALHDAAILEEGWVMDGNYSILMPQRFARTTGIIVIDDHYLRRFVRYLRRTLFEPDRAGGLEGKRDSIKLEMINWIWKTRNSFRRYHGFALKTGLPVVTCRSLDEVKSLYRAWALD